MKKLKYLIFIVFGILLFNSCEEEESIADQISKSPNIAAFESYKGAIGALANGEEYTRYIPVKIEGPRTDEINSDVNLSISTDESSTAEADIHYRIETPSVTINKSGNFRGLIEITLITEGNSPPLDGTPEFDSYVAPVLNLKIASVSGHASVIPTGKIGSYVLNFTPPNPYAGDYDVEMKYFHPTAGGSYPDEPYGGIRALEKTLIAVTGRKCETGFGVWQDTDICWITVNADNSIAFVVDDTWPYDVVLGDPNDPTKVSYYDPDTRQIYLYYHYQGTGGPRIFWEVFTPKF